MVRREVKPGDRNVYVARMVKDNERGHYERFLENVGRRLGQIATTTEVEESHVTFLANPSRIKQALRVNGYAPEDVYQRGYDMQMYLDGRRPRSITQALINWEDPLVWLGSARNKLSLRVVPDSSLLEQRAHVEDFLRQRFGEVPALHAFVPHIAIASVDRQEISPDMRALPELLLDGIHIPQAVALQGLRVYLDNLDCAVSE